jgi:hypothetical protein
MGRVFSVCLEHQQQKRRRQEAARTAAVPGPAEAPCLACLCVGQVVGKGHPYLEPLGQGILAAASVLYRGVLRESVPYLHLLTSFSLLVVLCHFLRCLLVEEKSPASHQGTGTVHWRRWSARLVLVAAIARRGRVGTAWDRQAVVERDSACPSRMEHLTRRSRFSCLCAVARQW